MRYNPFAVPDPMPELRRGFSYEPHGKIFNHSKIFRPYYYSIGGNHPLNVPRFDIKNTNGIVPLNLSREKKAGNYMSNNPHELRGAFSEDPFTRTAITQPPKREKGLVR